ncbi:1-aminocyclopropane-1-carboxylate deaminase/D-cysteine desulfhydrase [Chryseobacterium sp. HSC-36S06]|uniref:1-aminocyclopropane-1-carboxylate deaminase/D-cysteine desulfhydrase n=1 Tax=Chryseobacterium sp. HSC-36S06 TaxID=2910970 RepID=UPI00209CA17A|nr:pyridoxal-phosphate dependent enzyme [Chryseobacterium sp. HSC-36S06]MCP2038913.1 1-aminocyclopropane-1-carboxylate deaminase [Chryseobacterium sp. HSC-36S06]
MTIPEISIPLTEIPLEKNIKLFIKREDLIHPGISGNKFWKLYYNINQYLQQQPEYPFIVTFGGAFSNHIAAVSALGKEQGIKTLGIIRGEELEDKWQENPTLAFAHTNGMAFRFVTRTAYRNKESLTRDLQKEFSSALIIPEGGTNHHAVKGIQHMLNEGTKSFDYLCTAVGTGGTVSGLSKFAGEHQQVLGFKAVNDPTLDDEVFKLSGRKNFTLFEAHDGSYGKITDENIRFINNFSEYYGIQLDPVYTGKMMRLIFRLIEEDLFPENARILAFHTGGLQGISGANRMLEEHNRPLIRLIKS